MKTFNQESVDALNRFLALANDAEAGFQKASEAVADPFLKSTFTEFADTRKRFGYEIKSEISNLGSKINRGGTIEGKAHRTWIDVKSLLSSEKDEAILEECIRGDETVVQEYREILENMDLSITTRRMLKRQYELLKRALNTLKAQLVMA